MGLWCGALGTYRRRVQLCAKGGSGNLLPKEEGKLASRDTPRGRLRLLGLFRGLFGTVRHQISRLTLGETEPVSGSRPFCLAERTSPRRGMDQIERFCRDAKLLEKLGKIWARSK